MRSEGIDEALETFIENRRNAPFLWGSNDCCIFASDWVKQITGTDPAEGIRGTYSTSYGAARVLLPFGGVEEIADACKQLKCVPRGFVFRGDIVSIMTNNNTRPALGICTGRFCAYVSEYGISFIDTSKISKAWRVK
jgi:hypothetical protein